MGTLLLRNYCTRCFLVIVFIIFSISGFSTNYYVSNAGNDSNNGLSSDFPWKTLLKVNSFTFKPGDQILFERSNTFYGTLTINSSGVSGKPILYGAYGTGSNPTITGFTTITGGWTDEGNGVFSKIIDSESQTNMVTIDDVQYGMGRFPNSTFLTYESALGYVSITDNQLSETPNWTGAEVVIYKKGYRIERAMITNHTSNTLTYSILSGTNMEVSGSNKYFIQNDLRTLDQYGEWFHNKTTNKFYMYFGEVNPTTKTVKVASLNNLCKINSGKSYITIDGLSYSGSIKGELIAQYNCHYISIQNSTFNFAGTDGIFIDGQSASIINSTFNFCNRISILTVGINATISNNSVSNNAVIIGQGNTGYGGTSAIMASRDNPTIINNNIQNTATNGIFVSSDVQTGLVKNNYIYNSCIWNWDHGAIYASGYRTALTIDGNIIDKSGGNGIFLDAVGGNAIVKNNSVTDCALTGIDNHQQNNNTFLGNTVFNCKYGLRLLNAINLNNMFNITSTGNIFVAKTSAQVALYYFTSYTGYVTTLPTFSFSDNIYARPIDDNKSIYYNGLGFGGYKTLEEWKVFFGQDANSKKSPQSISSENDLRFEYNASALPKTITLDYPMIDIKGTKYTSNVILQPYSSIVLMKDANPDLGDLIAPVVTGFAMPPSSNSLMVPITSLSATDNIGITGYLLTETSTKPTLTASGWSTSKPTSYTFTTEGTKSLYAWVKDLAGNISVGISVQVVISLPSNAFTIGNTEVYSQVLADANRRAMPFTSSETGSIQSISIYHNGGTGNVMLGVYSDLSGNPSSLLGMTSSTEINATAGWQTVALTNPVTVTAGQTIWLAWVFQNNPGVRYTTGSPGRAQSLATWTDGMPSTFGASYLYNTKYSIYCTYTLKTNTLGNTEVYSQVLADANRRAMPFTSSETGSIQSISIYHNGGTGNVLLGVYSDQSGNPSSLLGMTSSTVINATAGWQTVALTNPVTVAAGQTVWLAWVFQNNPGVRYTTGSPGRAQSLATWTDGMPSTFGSSFIYNTKYSIYCTYALKTTTLKNANITDIISIDSALQANGNNDLINADKSDESSSSQSGEIDFKLYPNPAKSIINVDYTSLPERGTTIEIIDSNGKKVFEQLHVSLSNMIDIKKYNRGIYLIRSKYKQNFSIKKLVIQ